MRGGGGQKMSVFVHTQGIKTVHAGGGAKKWQNSIHVVVEWPQRVIKNEKFHFRTPSTKSEIALAKEDASGYLAR